MVVSLFVSRVATRSADSFVMLPPEPKFKISGFLLGVFDLSLKAVARVEVPLIAEVKVKVNDVESPISPTKESVVAELPPIVKA